MGSTIKEMIQFFQQINNIFKRGEGCCKLIDILKDLSTKCDIWHYLDPDFKKLNLKKHIWQMGKVNMN